VSICPKMIDEAKLDTLVQQIFVDSFKTVKFERENLAISPFDVEKVKSNSQKSKFEELVSKLTVFPYDLETLAYEKFPQFNDEFGDYVKLNVFSISGENPQYEFVLEFKEDPKTVGKFFRDFSLDYKLNAEFKKFPFGSETGNAQTLIFEGGKGVFTFIPKGSINIRHSYPQNLRLDNTDDSVQTYLILGEKIPGIFPQLLKAYIKDKAK